MTGTEKPRPQVGVTTPAPTSIELSGPAVPRTVGTFRHRSRDFALANGAEARVAEDVALAVSEAVTNVVKHGYEQSEVGPVGLTASVADGFLEIAVTDHGLGFRDHDASGLGLGLAFIAELSASLDISQSARGTEIRMRFLLASDAP